DVRHDPPRTSSRLDHASASASFSGTALPRSTSSPPPRSPSWVGDERNDGLSEAGTPPLALEEGVRLAGKYRLLRTAGFGGMAQLWVAHNESTGAEVCIKVLVPETNDDESVQRFRREAYAVARLSHR